MSSSGGPGGWGRVTSGFYHGGGVGGGPSPGVCGSPPSSRARRFHFPGCPGVNIRVSAPLPQRRAAATFLPRPGRPGPAPHAAGSPPMSAQGRGDRQVWSSARGGGARLRELRGGSCGRDGARRLTGWAGRGSGPSVAVLSAPRLPSGEGCCPHPDPPIRSGVTEAGGCSGTLTASLPGGDAEGTALGGVRPSPPHPVRALSPTADPELLRAEPSPARASRAN